jgi:hypothetical protein
MRTEFEMMAFEMEDERGMRGRMGGAASGATRAIAARAPKPKPPAPHGWPGKQGKPRRPRWPLGGGWTYPVYAPWPEPGPGPEPEPDPDPDPDPGFGPDAGADAGADGDAPQDEGPTTVEPALRRLPAAVRPAYKPLGQLSDAVRTMGQHVAGLYLIEFDVDGRKRAYSGQSDDVRRRLQQHLLCATMLGLPVAGHRVFVAVSDQPDGQRRLIEKGVHDKMFAHRPGVLTNQRRELEAELFGQSWR